MIKKGFTLVEITLVIVLIAILIAITTPLVSSVIIRNDLGSAHESLYNVLLRAQQLSKTQYKDSQWRVCIDNNAKTYTITSGTCTATQYPEIITINSGIIVSSEQTLDIPFKLINGELDSTNEFIKIDLTGGGVSKSIIINKSGVINKEATTATSSNTTTPNIVTNGLVLHLDAGNIASYPGTGTTWTDLSGNNNNGTLVNGVGYNNANGGALVFDGVNDYVDLKSTYYISTSSPFTANIFFKINPKPLNGTQSDFHRILTLRSQGTSTLGIAYVPQLNSGYEGLYITNNNGWVRAKTAQYLSSNTWVMLTLTYNGLGSTNIQNFQMFLNTTPLNFNTSGLATPAVTSDNNFLGIRQQVDIQTYRGDISYISLYNRQLTEQEIQQNFNATKGRFGL